MDSSRISPTAHYTGSIWARHGLSHPALSSRLNGTLYQLARPLVWATAPLVGGLSLELALLQRHRLIEAVIVDAVEQRGVRQIVEIAAGMSARGLRLSERFADRELVYVEADLPQMAAGKREALSGLRGPRHHVVDVDALQASGPLSLPGATAALLDPGQPTLVITEGLLNYFQVPQVLELWGRIASFLGAFPEGTYVFDLICGDVLVRLPQVGIFFRALSVVARGRTTPHFRDPEEAAERLREAGFDELIWHLPAAWKSRLDLPMGTRGELQSIGEARLARRADGGRTVAGHLPHAPRKL